MPQSIPLTRGQYATVDDADYPALARFRWFYTSTGYAARSAVIDGKHHTLLMHRVLTDALPGQIVDHINGDKLDNRRANLRLVTPAQNQHNRKAPTRSSSGFKGVQARDSRWIARIYVDGRCVHLGFHDDPVTAALVWDHAARRFFGAYARLNFPDQPESAEYSALLDQVLAGTQPKRKRQPKAKVPRQPSRYKVVYWERGCWRASIKVEGKKQHLGYFMDEEAAARAYDMAAVAQFGERAVLNFP
jgi:hypothetical protein